MPPKPGWVPPRHTTKPRRWTPLDEEGASFAQPRRLRFGVGACTQVSQLDVTRCPICNCPMTNVIRKQGPHFICQCNRRLK